MHYFINFIFLILVLALPAQAFETDQVKHFQDRAIQLNLQRDPIWLKLLYFREGDSRSQVISDDFFLSPKGQMQPEAEMLENISAFLHLDPEISNHAICKFPARYFWLNKHLAFPLDLQPLQTSQKLQKWALERPVESVSLYFVSGYLGNPASAFGHCLLRFNTYSPDDHLGLFDTALNYGALVPSDENAVAYIFKGMFGGYTAGFSDKYYYTQDLVYTRTEFRDIWEYELNLSEDQKSLLLLHLWEIMGKKFRYYFLEENCAYRMAELIQLIIKESLINDVSTWYAPIELFQSLEAINTERLVAGQPLLIKAIKPIPSHQRKLYHQFLQLPKEHIYLANKIIRYGLKTMKPEYDKLNDQEKSSLLEAILSYFLYKMASDSPDEKIKREAAKKEILLARFALAPKQKQAPASPPSILSPAKGTKPIEANFGLAMEDHQQLHGHFSISPYSRSAVGKNQIRGEELVVAEGAFSFNNEAEILFDHFDLIRLRKVDVTPFQLEGERHISWELKLNSSRLIQDRDRHVYDTQGLFLAGKSWELGSHTTTSLMGGGSLHTVKPFVRYRPEISSHIDIGNIKIFTFSGLENQEDFSRVRLLYGAHTQWEFLKNRIIQLKVNNEKAITTSLSCSFYW